MDPVNPVLVSNDPVNPVLVSKDPVNPVYPVFVSPAGYISSTTDPLNYEAFSAASIS
jgi:hypothetical protein